eukprot:CAMPEP_0171164188 /NCGR_PEP_ID=MMETSP0790-20130122/5539_1 /TAXON_ID=2925 /ORGANISM="Alexandrium catenella, Strain OF101" /LENGTH=62 /DNA_ID=CAMNT_0011628935 /DNA_START=278 /DNA_END=466 /DNA_ORIENTATION=+
MSLCNVMEHFVTKISPICWLTSVSSISTVPLCAKASGMGLARSMAASTIFSKTASFTLWAKA